MLPFLKPKRTAPGLTGIELRDDGIAAVHVVREPGRPARVTACDFRAFDGDPSKQEKILASLASDFDLKRARCTTVLAANDYTLLLTEAPDVPA